LSVVSAGRLTAAMARGVRLQPANAPKFTAFVRMRQLLTHPALQPRIFKSHERVSHGS